MHTLPPILALWGSCCSTMYPLRSEFDSEDSQELSRFVVDDSRLELLNVAAPSGMVNLNYIIMATEYCAKPYCIRCHAKNVLEVS